MTELIERALRRLGELLPGRISRPGDSRYAAATAIWPKPVGAMPRAVAHCLTPEDVRSAILAARESGLPLSVRAGGHDWAGRALCEGLVIDLSGMNGIAVDVTERRARIAGGARAADVVKVTDPLGLAAVTGSAGAVGMAGLTLGGGYGPLIGRFGLALDNLVAAEVVLADGRLVVAGQDNEEELFWALRGGGNFGVVTAMRHRLHDLTSVCSGTLIYPSSEARAVLERVADIAASAPDELTVQVGFVAGPDGAPVVFVAPTWCGRPERGEAQVAPFLKLGTVLAGAVETTSYGASLGAFDAYIVNGCAPSWRRAGCLRSRATASPCSSRPWRPPSPRVAPWSPTSSGAPPRAFRGTQRPLAFVTSMCWSRSLLRSPTGRTGSRSSDTASGPARRVTPSMRWRFPAAIRTSLPGATPTVRQGATAATPNGCSRPSGSTTPTTSSAPLLRCRLAGKRTGIPNRHRS
jgi:hypothetical protein